VGPAIVVVLGYPGTGKFTVAKELVSDLNNIGRSTRLVHSHAAANVVFDLIPEADGKTPLPIGIFRHVRDINLTVIRTIEELSPPGWTFVFTHHLLDTPEDVSHLGRLEALAHSRGSAFVVVVLTCAQDALLARVIDPDRRSSNKLIDPSIAVRIIEKGMLTPNRAISIDTTARDPRDIAQLILAELA
jgi:predicted kinase